MQSERPSPSSDSQPPNLTPFQTHYKAAVALLEAGDAEKAARKFQQAAIADPEKWCEAAIEIGRAGNPKLALAALAELLKLDASALVQSGTWCAIGNVYSNAGNRPEAMECFLKSWDAHPSPGAASNRALIHLWNGEVSDAERWIKRSLEMNPWQPEPQFVQSMISMVGRGHYRTGFQQYECRWRARESGLKKLPADKPEWRGPEQSSGTLLVYGEQGMGDTILALRYARLIKVLGLRQVWVIQPSIKTLAESMGIIDEVRNPGEEFHNYDFHIPAISLIRAFGTSLETIPPAPYLQRPNNPLALKQFRIGICWGGSSVNRNNSIRSASLEHWKPVLELSSLHHVSFHSLQVDEPFSALLFPQIQTHGSPQDWLETSQRIAHLDLIISVDTALVHLAGAMGVPCWCALHCRPYFVYPITREDCPWYPSVRLFRQKKEHDWKEVFDNIATELLRVIGKVKEL